ncbi:IS607 family element RNA-guided endonuclease TnpB [Nocardia sp. NBC_00565]|uniref:IS607 family element RNA-guided endonuclease TnpB n=1 Tax=Nocardia sp. NBC_00565 TaxID=2975993 RepID=UPI002E8236BF|nr:IS607 family element RNA-guided endonuclease TnpB [Nocardia sp. NBC_00565]WUC05730.1 IS607 family element RNA-guided endonuclease TnpB [Nocardia sp. NBC_00565]
MSEPMGLGEVPAVEAARVIQAYKFALDPTPAQEHQFRSSCGAQRFAYNWALDRVRANIGQRSAEASYGLTGDELTPPVSWSAFSLRKDWNAAKDTVAPWWFENSKETYSSGISNLTTALKNWADSRTGKRAGPKVGFPRCKTKRSRLTVRFTTGAFGLTHDRRHVRLPRIGAVRTHESTRKLARHTERGTARIRSATVSYAGGRWFVSFSVEVERTQPTPSRPNDVVGVDVGVKALAVLSTGEVIANPKHLDRAQRELRRLQRRAARRRGPDRRTGVKSSKRWRDSQTRITRLHARVANARADGLHKLTTRLTTEYGTVVAEDLNIAGMMKNRRLARGIADAGFGELRRQLEYKTDWGGGRLVVADRWYPSSKTCSDCGATKTKLRLSERTYYCDQCGLVLDRDLNAARNLAGLVASTASCVGTVNTPAGNPHKTRPRRATGTATGRPAPHGAGQPCRSNPAGHGTELHVS